jgi:single-stranded-DNA-specific exonuclease
MEKKWQTLPKINDKLAKKFPEISPVILQLLFNRGIETQKQIDEFLNPDYSQDIHDPFLFNDMKKAIARTKKAIENNEKVVIHGDYDADGVCATVILFVTLKKLGLKNLDIYLPHREKEGYGLNLNTIEYFKKNKIDLIITCDCGVSNFQEIKQAKKYSIDTIITDHHHGPKILPEAVAILNPIIKDEKYPFKYLSGCGVAFKFIQALLEDFNYSAKESFEKWLLDMVALGTVADISQLVGENRTLVKYGLVVLAKTKNLGLQKLMNVSGIDNKKINTHTIGFQIAPRINSAGRINHANTAFKLLSTQNIEEAIIIASELNKNNQERQKITERTVNEAINLIKPDKSDDKIFFAYSENWNSGIIGLVAGKICQEFHRPTFIFTANDNQYVASGRSIPEFNIIEAITTQSGILERFGGHSGACGLTIKKENYKLFCKNLKEFSEVKLKDIELLPILSIDAELDITKLNWKIVDQLEKFAPFGNSNPKPKFVTRNLTVNEVKPVGNNNQHLKIKINDRSGAVKKVIIFNCETVCPNLQIDDKIDLVYEIIVNTWNGNKEIELNCLDLKK